MSNSYSSKVKAAHGGGGNFPKFPFDMQFDSRLAENNKALAVFEYWDKNANEGKGERKVTTAAIEGPLIGKAMMLQAYHKQSKTWYRSTPFFSMKDRVVIFRTANGVHDMYESGGKKSFTAEEAKNVMLVAAQSAAKNMNLIYIAYLGSTQVNVIRVTTNLTLAISDFKEVKMETFQSHQIRLTPTVFNKNSTDKIKKLDKIALSALEAVINDPEGAIGYSEISSGVLIDQTVEAAFGAKGRTLGAIMDEWIEWKEHITGGNSPESPDGVVDTGNQVINTNNPTPSFNAAPAPDFGVANNTAPANNNNGINDDLPF